jgi:hypothetical protein
MLALVNSYRFRLYKQENAMRQLTRPFLVMLLWLVGSPVHANDGSTGFWVTLGQPAAPAAVIILYGTFCALWAQNTRRNAWLWFFLGVVFNVLTLAILLYKNAEDRRSATTNGQ